MSVAAAPNHKVARRAGLFALTMLLLAFASVPLYRAFCQATGFGGTPLRAEAAPGAEAAAGTIGVRFDSNVDSRLPWKFEPVERTVRIRPGQKTTIWYEATNLTARTTHGQAVFNVSPEQAGPYFNKIECFCFSEQTLKAGESVKMPVVFFVDPKIAEAAGDRPIDEITLSYTFYPLEK